MVLIVATNFESGSSKTALLVVDMQKGLDEADYYGGNRNNPRAEENAATLLAYWRLMAYPIFHIQHSSLNPHSKLHPAHPGFEIKEEVRPISGETILVKNVNSAFIGTTLNQQLREQKITHVVIIGLTTNHCISSTARSAANLGFDTTVISDATATFDLIGIDGQRFDSELVHQLTLANLKGEFATIKTKDEFLKDIQSG